MTTTITLPVAPVGDGAASALDAVRGLLARWRRDGTTFVVVDERGRHRDALAAGRLDLTRAAVRDLPWIDATMHRAGFVLLDAGNVPRVSRPQVVGRALTAVQRLRARTGRPEWILVEAAQDVLRGPGIPPHALRLSDGGYCFVARDGGSLPGWATTGAASGIRLSGPGLELSMMPPRQSGEVFPDTT